MPLTVLITGFGPFPGAQFNPTTALPHRLAARRRPALAEVTRIAHVFPTSYAAVDADLPALLERVRPDVVLLFGVATRTDYLRVETRARNARSVLFSDVDGHRPGRNAIATAAPATLAGIAPHPVLLAAVRATRLPTRLSHSAGRYLCNFAYWRALEAAYRGGALVQFIHVPMVRRGPVRAASGRRRLTAGDLLRASEAILLTLVSAARVRRREARKQREAALRAAPAAPLQLQRRQKSRQRQAVAG
jgi:pyroglutamyl-peptidase